MAMGYEVEEEKRKGKAGREEQRSEDKARAYYCQLQVRQSRSYLVRDVSHSCGSP
jgi:hypothetical protein